MADPTFVTNQLAELPGTLNGPQGRAWATGTGTVMDGVLAVGRVAALSRLPFYCPDDALDAVGAFLVLPRYVDEPNGTAPTQPGFANGTGYRGRLCTAWRSWIIAGSKGSIIASLQSWGVPDVAVQNDYEASPPFPGSWWSRFRVILGPDFGAYGWGVGNDPTTEQQRQIVAQVLKWKWAYAYAVEVVLDYGGGSSFVITIGPLIGHGFIIGVDTIGGYRSI